MRQPIANYAAFEQRLIVEAEHDYICFVTWIQAQWLTDENNKLEVIVERHEHAGPHFAYSLKPDILILLGVLIQVYWWDQSHYQASCGLQVQEQINTCAVLMLFIIVLISCFKWNFAIQFGRLLLGLLIFVLFGNGLNAKCMWSERGISAVISVLDVIFVYRTRNFNLRT